ncbi:GIY-YIG nuclease family protein [Sphingomonas hankookensis]
MTRAEYAERLEQGERLGWVYFLETGPTSPIKIGWAKDPIKRANQLQTGHPEELILIGVLPGSRHLEGSLHRQLSIGRLNGEWFERGRTLRIVRPVLKSHGIIFRTEVQDSRTIPEHARRGTRRNRNYLVDLQE